jgi:hypothetical protein
MSEQSSEVNGRKLMDRLAPNPDVLGPLLGVLATTFEFDATFFEFDFLPMCLGLGAWDDRKWTSRIALQRALAGMEATVLLMDGRRYRGRPRSLHVEVRPVVGDEGQLQHAKVLLLVHEKAVRLLVGSANVTEAGYRMNREAVLPLVVNEERPELAPLVRSALDAMPTVLAPWWTESAELIRSHALERLARWAPTAPIGDARFVWSGHGEPLWRTFLSEWGHEEPVESISIVSPFWSEEKGTGPMTHFLSELRSRQLLQSGTRLELYGEASTSAAKTARPRLPESLLAFEATRFEVAGFAHAVDPMVLPDEVGGRTDFVQRRSLHAKVVLLRGRKTSLAYVGSANFTRHGWGFPGVPGRPNIEAGVILKRTGVVGTALARLIPSTVGQSVELGASTLVAAASAEEESDDDVIWPTFLREASLTPRTASERELLLEVKLFPERLSGPFELRLSAGGELLARWAPESEAPVDTLRIPLGAEALQALLQSKEIHVGWWVSREGQSFPVNLDMAARLQLPMGESAGLPGERLLLAYYQGRIAFEDLFPPPPGFEEPGGTAAPALIESEVDTSRIQSYQIRSFVEALTGIEHDLRKAAEGTETSLRLALLGPVSPLTLGREVAAAVKAGQRSATAGAFQVVEIAAALRRTGEQLADVPERAATFEKYARVVREEFTGLLQQLRKDYPGEVGTGSFQRYVRSIQPGLWRAS